MDAYPSDELEQARAPIASLISKSEKAQQKLAPGTWQHAMLRDNLAALRIATALMEGEPEASAFTADQLHEALRALASMIDRTEKSGAKFAAGTSQHSLQRNRLSALRLAEKLVRQRLEEG